MLYCDVGRFYQIESSYYDIIKSLHSNVQSTCSDPEFEGQNSCYDGNDDQDRVRKLQILHKNYFILYCGHKMSRQVQAIRLNPELEGQNCCYDGNDDQDCQWDHHAWIADDTRAQTRFAAHFRV